MWKSDYKFTISIYVHRTIMSGEEGRSVEVYVSLSCIIVIIAYSMPKGLLLFLCHRTLDYLVSMSCQHALETRAVAIYF